MSLGLFAQTTIDEYNYASGGFKKAAELGIGSKQGYTIVPFTGLVDSYYSSTWKGEYSISLLLRMESNEDSIAAVILEKGASTYCVPHPYSDALMTSRSMTDFAEFWNSYNDALMFQLIQTAVWGNSLNDKNKNRIIVTSDHSVANHYEHEPDPEYTMLWGEFDYFLDGRKPAYNAHASHTNYSCNQQCEVVVKFVINEKGLVQNAEVVDDVYFRSYDGRMITTNLTSACIESYAIELAKQDTYYPKAGSSTTGYVLYRFLLN